MSFSCRREKELAKVTIKKEDLELIVSRAGRTVARPQPRGTAPKVCVGVWWVFSILWLCPCR